MEITSSSYNQDYRNGAKERLIWGRRNGSIVFLGGVGKTSWGEWESTCDDLKGGKVRFTGKTLKAVMAQVKSHYL